MDYDLTTTTTLEEIGTSTTKEDFVTTTTEAAQLDLGLLWEMIDRHRLSLEGEKLDGQRINTTWELVIIQGVLLTLLIIVAIVWAICCRRRCKQRQEELSVAEALRKVSAARLKDLPPSYSKTDLHTLGISVNDYLHPPPQYLDLFTDNLQYLDLEQGHNRLAKLSFCDDDGNVPRMARLSVASCENCNSESPVVVPVRSPRSSTTSMSSSLASSSRRPSRNSRVSFSEEVECSNGSIRRLSTNSLISLKSSVTDSSSSSHSSRRSSSSSSDGSRKSSLKSNLQRKFGSSEDNSFVANLDEELRRKLDSIGEDDNKEEVKATVVTAELQAERAARICDIIVEEREK